MQRVRSLTQLLLLSVALNIGLVATFIYFAAKEKTGTIAVQSKPSPSAEMSQAVQTIESVLRNFSTGSFSELLSLLQNKEHVEEGCLKRDLALGCLVTFHHLAIDRALGGLIPETYGILFVTNDHENIDLKVFRGLTDEQFNAVVQFAKTEQWPFTSKGLFFEIKRSQKPRNSSLLEAFYLTSEFYAVSMLIGRSGLHIEKEVLVDMLAEGDWKILEDFSQEQKKTQDLSVTRRRSLLLQYCSSRSKTAARILIESDLEFALKRLDDSQVLTILEILSERSAAYERFLKEILRSPRTDIVRKKAAVHLYTFVKEPIPEPFDEKAALKRFAAEGRIVEQKAQASSSQIIPKAKHRRVHLVQEGDSLWKIAKRYHVSIEAIIKLNRLETDKLRLGQKLEIPDR